MRHALRWCLLASVIAVNAAHAFPKLELEIGGGGTPSQTFCPLFTGRVGLDLFGFLSPSVRLLTLTPMIDGTSQWNVTGELRLHTKGRVQLTGGVGVGFLTADVITTSRRFEARVAPTPHTGLLLTVDLGVRVTFWRMWVGANVTSLPLTQQWLGTLNVGIGLFG